MIASDNFQLHLRLPLAAANKDMCLSSQMDNERRVLSETVVLLLIGGAVMGLAGLVHTLSLRLWYSDLEPLTPPRFESRNKHLCFLPSWQDNQLAKSCGHNYSL